MHDLGANKPHTQLRNSALTRLLQPSLCGHAVVAVIVTSSARPHERAGRETLEALHFGVAAGRLTLAPTRRTAAAADGHLAKLQVRGIAPAMLGRT